MKEVLGSFFRDLERNVKEFFLKFISGEFEMQNMFSKG